MKFTEWEPHIQELYSLLSEDEQNRAHRFHFLKDQQRYIIRRSLLRKILGRYLRIPAQQIVFQYNQFGKPILPDTSLRFNLSYSRDAILIAVTKEIDVGIDVEYITEDPMQQEIAERFFSSYEVNSLAHLSGKERALGFFLCWTRKEAFIKAKGEGLTYPLHQFDVSVDPNDPPKLLRTAFDPDETKLWRLFNLEPAQHYAAAVAVNSEVERIVHLTF